MYTSYKVPLRDVARGAAQGHQHCCVKLCCACSSSYTKRDVRNQLRLAVASTHRTGVCYNGEPRGRRGHCKRVWFGGRACIGCICRCYPNCFFVLIAVRRTLPEPTRHKRERTPTRERVNLFRLVSSHLLHCLSVNVLPGVLLGFFQRF